MKKTYISPKALIVELQINNSVLLTISETEVDTSKGGWVKEDVGSRNSTVTDKSVWDSEW
jgi:hypothetical protein